MEIDIGFWNKDGDYIEDIQVVDLIEENKEPKCEVEQLRQQLK